MYFLQKMEPKFNSASQFSLFSSYHIFFFASLLLPPSLSLSIQRPQTECHPQKQCWTTTAGGFNTHQSLQSHNRKAHRGTRAQDHNGSQPSSDTQTYMHTRGGKERCKRIVWEPGKDRERGGGGTSTETWLYIQTCRSCMVRERERARGRTSDERSGWETD